MCQRYKIFEAIRDIRAFSSSNRGISLRFTICYSFRILILRLCGYYFLQILVASYSRRFQFPGNTTHYIHTAQYTLHTPHFNLQTTYFRLYTTNYTSLHTSDHTLNTTHYTLLCHNTLFYFILPS